MDKYRRVTKSKPETSEIKENEIRITTQGKMRSYIAYATSLFQKGATVIILKAMGLAINKTVTIAEIIKRRIKGLHQNTQINSTEIVEVWEPLEEGLDRVETSRQVSSIQITLSTEQLDANDPGYQPPLPVDQVQVIPLGAENITRRGRGRGRGRFRGTRGRQFFQQGPPGNQPFQQGESEQPQSQDQSQFQPQFQPQFQGRPFRGKGQPSTEPTDAPFRGRGRGRGGRGGGRGRGTFGRGGRGTSEEVATEGESSPSQS